MSLFEISDDESSLPTTLEDDLLLGELMMAISGLPRRTDMESEQNDGY